ncbi:hypothetical protein [uncultured Pseudodesulfovibrio sp.]|uniref:hypothetical protein n=1 Tax=uncultured Pseudodesulfovibrio sp. TaxID=2035858 RepID=UPI0029C79375|nr:hypothetical protein [uncultured Pseudodesulfovibrio sp.]
MSDISMASMSIASAGINDQLAGMESVKDTVSTVMSGLNENGADAMEQTIIGAEVASRTSDYIGSGPDFTSTGTDVDVQQAINSTLMSGIGSIANKIA